MKIFKDIALCVAYPNEFSISETFIKAHLDYLKPPFTLYNGFHPVRNQVGKLILPFPLNILTVRGSLRNVFPSVFHYLYSKILSKYLLQNGIEFLLAEYGPTGVALSDACASAKIPFIVHFHGFDAYEIKTIEMYATAYKKMFEGARAIIAVSVDMKNRLIDLGADPSKVLLNPYGVNTEKFKNAEPVFSKPLFIAVGRLTAKKSPLNTIKAFSIVVKQFPDARLVMIGDGELHSECSNLIKQLRIGEYVELCGAQSHEFIAEYLQKGRAFVQHSMQAPGGDSEGTPNTILEAEASGLPIVSTFHAGIKEAVVHGETGFLVSEGDIDGMAEYMLRLAKDVHLAQTMGSAAQKYIQDNYRMDVRISRLKEIIESCCA